MQAADIQNIDQIIANSLTSGSIKTSMVIAADPNQDFSSFTTSYQNNIDNGNLDGLTIISSSNTINNQEEETLRLIEQGISLHFSSQNFSP